MIKSIGMVVLGFLTSCSNHGQLTYVAKLPNKISENSGMVSFTNTTVWFVEDSGNPDELYQVNHEGTLLRELKVKNAKNHDWEDLTKDPKGNVYIGDFGNNHNKRKDLTIYKIPNPEREPGDKIDAEKIAFRYPQQKKFPPPKEQLFYDAEALFYHAGFLYIITKNRSRPFTGSAFIYKVPAQAGTYLAELVGSFTTCKGWNTCEVTSADIAPDGKKIVLLGYGKLWVFTNFTFDDFSKGKMQTIELGVTTQLESVCFTDNNTLLLSDEARGNTGRNLYSYQLD